MNRNAILILFFVVLCFHVAHAQFDIWEPSGGVSPRDTRTFQWSGNGFDVDENGNTMTVWSDNRNGNQDIFVQLRNPDGELVWLEESKCIASGASADYHPIIRYADDGTWYIAWVAVGHLHNHRVKILMQRINQDGERMWYSQGMLIEFGPDNPSIDLFEFVQADSSGCLFSWTEDNTYFSVQKMNPNGTIAWGGAPPIISSVTYYAAVTDDGNGGVYCAWYDFFTTEPRAQHITADGDQILGEPEEGIRIGEATLSFNNLTICSDRHGGAFIAWQARREDGFDVLMGQHIESDGDLEWDLDGTPLCNIQPNIDSPQIFPAGDGDFIITWLAGQTTESLNIYAERIGTVGSSPELHWSTGNGMPFSDLNFTDSSPVFNLEDDSNYTLNWSRRSGNGNEIVCQRFDENGTFLWDNPVTIRTQSVSREFQALWSPDESMHICWTDYNDEQEMFVHQSFAEDGSPLWGERGIQIRDGNPRHASSPSIVRSGINAFVSWRETYTDTDNLTYDLSPRIQVFSIQSGVAQLSRNGAELIHQTPFLSDDETSPALCAIVEDGNNGAMIVWNQVPANPNAPSILMGQRITEEGERLWGNGGRDLPWDNSVYRSISDLQLIDIGNGTCLIVFQANNLQDHSALMVNCIDHDGTPAWENHPDGMVLSQGNEKLSVAGIEKMPDGSVIIIYSYNQANGALASGISPVGELLWENPLYIANVELTESIVTSVCGSEVVIAWIYGVNEIRGQVLTNEGEIQFPLDGRIIYESVLPITKATSCESIDLTTWMIWEADTMIWANRFTDRFEMVLEPGEPIQIAVTRTDCKEFDVCSDMDGGAYLFWQTFDYYHDLADQLGYTHVLVNGALADDDYHPDGADLCTAYHSQTKLSLCPNGESGVLAVWEDQRSSSPVMAYSNVYAMRVNDLTVDCFESPVVSLPSEWRLFPAYPNPFNPSTSLSFTVPEYGLVRLTVYDILGREVVRLEDGPLRPGFHTYPWNGMDRNGRAVASGTYFFRLDGDGIQETRSMILLK